MGLVKADAKIRIKRAELLGVEPTPGPSLDHTDGSWNDTDIYVSELMMNTGQPGVEGSIEKLWIRTEQAIRHIPLSSNGGSAGQMLVLTEDDSYATWVDMPVDLSGFDIAENGLYSMFGTTVRLGGPLTEPTLIDGGSYSFTFNSATAGIEYGSQFHNNYTLRSLVDKEYVDLEIAGIGGTLQGATNGLHLDGTNVSLGGELIENTLITGDAKNFKVKGTNNAYDPTLIGELNIGTSFNLSQTSGNQRTSIGSDLDGGDGMGISYFDYDTSEYQGVSIETGHFVEIGSALGPLYLNQGHAFIKTSYIPGEFLIIDGRTGSNNVGIEYDDDYSTNYTDRSLIDYEESYSHIGKAPLDVVAQNPTASEDGQFLMWDNTGGEYILADVNPIDITYTITTIDDTPTTLLSIPFGTGTTNTYKILIKGESALPIEVIGGDMLFLAHRPSSIFSNVGIIGGVDNNMKSNFASTSVNFDAVVSGNNVNIVVTGVAGKNVNWTATLDYV